MATFPAKYFRYSTRYPETGARVTFKNSYQFAAPSGAEDQRIFVLRLLGMQYFVDSQGEVDLTPHPERNMAVLDEFYNDHKLHASFDFEHPVYGTLRCRFHQPLEIPEGIAGGNGVIGEVTVQLLEQP